MMPYKLALAGSTCLAALGLLSSGAAHAQDGAAAAIGDAEITVTARKRGDEKVQDVPLAVTAFGPKQLDAINFRNVQSLSYTIPNVQLEQVGTVGGTANFSIRGLGIGSSIPSIDPTVGVFVDGMYMGVNTGVVVDNFDLGGVEVLRGPQGVLFGRNVTGGAVLFRTSAPTDTFTGNGRISLENGALLTVSGVMSGPISEGVNGKIAAYYASDQGSFHNEFTGRDQGKSTSMILRGALEFKPADGVNFTLRAEHGDIDGDGAAVQNHGVYSRKSHKFSQDRVGYNTGKWSQAILEGNFDVGFGDGQITSITGWRKFAGEALTDIDGTPSRPGLFNGIDYGAGAIFDLYTYTKQDQFSQELRYAGKFGAVDLTTGVFYFTQNVKYVERRVVDTNVAAPGQADLAGGGNGKFSTWAAFLAADVHLTDTLTLNTGIRYSYEKKKSDIARIRGAGNAIDGIIGGNFDTKTLYYTDPGYRPTWNAWSPKIGLQWRPDPSTQVYGYWALGQRSGGLNFRHTALSITPVPFDQEKQSSFEIGAKKDFFDRRLRLNFAVFRNLIDNMQRDQYLPDPVSGAQQIITNAGNARIQGFEFEAQLRLADNLLLTGQGGYQDAKYRKIFVDLTGDGLVNAADLALIPPRAAPWNYGASIVHDLELGNAGTLSTRVSYNHRDASFFTDNNVGVLNKSDLIDINLTYNPSSGPWSLSVYANNLTNENMFASDSPLPNIPGFGGDGAGPRPIPTASPLNKGRVYGAALRVNF